MTDEEQPRRRDLVEVSIETRARTFQAIGHFIYAFSQLEFSIRFALAAYLELPDEKFNAITGPYDFRMLCAVASKVGCLKYPDKADIIEKIYKDCQALNDKRNHIVHGLWNDGITDWSVRVFNRNTLEAAHRDYNSDAINADANQAQRLLQRIFWFNAQPLPAPATDPDENG